MQMYKVGGAVRDEILGVKTKDIDFSVVLEPGDITITERFTVTPFEAMVNRLKEMGYKIHKEYPERLTVIAQFPKDHPSKVRDADFVLARRESDYTDGRRPDVVEPGTLEDDIRRRDFTMNALAKDSEGNIIDLVNGQADIAQRLIRTVGDPKERMLEDALRVVRALRFSVTKGFRIEGSLMKVMMFDNDVLAALENNIAEERIMDELNKMLAFDTLKTLNALNEFPRLRSLMLSGSISLEATMKQRKGK